MINLEKYNLKTFRGGGNKRELTTDELKRWNKFKNWFSNHLKLDNLSLLFRGTTKLSFKDKVAKPYQTGYDDSWMRFIFEWGEKSKSFLKPLSNNFLLTQSIEDISEDTFEFIYEKIASILTQSEHERVIGFKERNVVFSNYFMDNNKYGFLKKIRVLDNESKIQVRNYYLRFIHTIFDFGQKNENSIFVSCSLNIRRAANFSKTDKTSDTGIILFYWLENPLIRFGLTIGIIQQMAVLLGENELPLYFNEFYPEDEEFCALGALFPGHIIGYMEKNDFVINHDLLDDAIALDDNLVKSSFQKMDRDLQRSEMYKKSNYWKQVTLWGNKNFTDRKLED